MNMASQMRTIVVPKFKQFCKHSSLHGMYYFYKSTGWCIHIVWCLVIALSVSLCCFLGHMIMEKFVRDPTLTVVESTHYSVTNIPFPAVSVCDTEKVYGPKAAEITELLLLRGYNMSEINQFYRSFTDVDRSGYTLNLSLKKIHSMLEDIGYNYKTLLDMLKRPCNNLIMECSWRARTYNCSEMFRPVFTVVGHCCQFDIPYFAQHSNNITHFASGIESKEALEISVNTQTISVDGNDTGNYPIVSTSCQLYVFDSQDRVTLVDGYIPMTPDALFDINVYVWAIDSSSYVKALSLENRRCILENDQGAGAGFYQGCMTRLILQKVVTRCKCLPYEYSASELGVRNYPECTWDRLLCINQAKESVQADIREILAETECYQRCDYIQYDTEVEYVPNHRSVNQNRATLSIHFAQATCLKYRREVLYTWDQMLANLGGIFGLCLGGSIISVVEIIWFLFEVALTVLAQACKGKTQSKDQGKRKIFIIPQKNMNQKKQKSGKVGPYKFVH